MQKGLQLGVSKRSELRAFWLKENYFQFVNARTYCTAKNDFPPFLRHTRDEKTTHQQ